MPGGLGKRLAIAALALGIPGLFTGGLLGVGALAGLLLATSALVVLFRAREAEGRDVAWAALAANAFALLSLVPLVVLALALQPMIAAQVAEDDALPTPWTPSISSAPPVLVPPPPPPPPPPFRAAAGAPHAAPDAEAPASVVGGAVRVGGQIKEPKKLKNVPPVYPDIAKQARVQGVVILECTVSPQGRVTHVTVLRGIPLLDDAAVEAVRQWVYSPTLLNGVPVPVILTVTVNFTLH